MPLPRSSILARSRFYPQLAHLPQVHLPQFQNLRLHQSSQYRRQLQFLQSQRGHVVYDDIYGDVTSIFVTYIDILGEIILIASYFDEPVLNS